MEHQGSLQGFDMDAKEDFHPHQRRRGRGWWTIPPMVPRVILFALAGWGLISIVLSLRDHPEKFSGHLTSSPAGAENICDCGSSINQAVAMGCHFVPMAAAWLPSACIDEELSNEFEAAGPGVNGSWSYWADAGQTREISIDDVSRLADSGEVFYTTWEWHVKHCTFYWRLDYRRRWLDTILEPRYDHESHITHCQMIIFADRTKPTGSIVKLNGSTSHELSHGHTS